MKIRMLQTPKGRPEYKEGETYEFNGPVEEGYARKFISQGWAEPADHAAQEAARADQERRQAEAKARAEQEAKAKAAKSEPKFKGKTSGD